MKSKRDLIRMTLVCLLCLTFLLPITAFAQTGDFREEFDEDSLSGWEYSEGVAVEDGSLLVPPGNFAVRFNDFYPESYTFDFKRSGPGVIIFRYAIDEGQEYVLIMHQEGIELELTKDATPQFLGGGPWESTSEDWVRIEIQADQTGQQVSVDGNLVFSTEEDSVLQGSGIGFWVEGETSAAFDNLILASPDLETEEVGDPVPEESQEITESSSAAQTDPGGGKMNLDDLISELSSSSASPTQLSTFIINLALAVVLSYILSRVYIHWGSSLSNRRRFAANFILITVTTTFIILVVRSSVALSLGLVGALSIVRFRSAIKEPEELAYLFFAISIGIGLGDNQRLITVIALAAAILVLGMLRLFRGRQADFNLHVSLVNSGDNGVDFDIIIDTLKDNCSQMKLIRFDDSGSALEISFLVEFKDMKELKSAKAALRGLSDSLEISFLDNKGIW